MLDAIADAYGRKSDDDDRDGERPPPAKTTLLATLFGKAIVVDERFPQPRLVEAITDHVIVALDADDVLRIATALQATHRGTALHQRFAAYVEGFRAGYPEATA